VGYWPVKYHKLPETIDRQVQGHHVFIDNYASAHKSLAIKADTGQCSSRSVGQRFTHVPRILIRVKDRYWTQLAA
jgi:hypothetical protein